MNVYIAALYTNEYRSGPRYANLTELERQHVFEVPHVLESYHYVKNPKYVEVMREQGAKVFMDSGAFSAHTLGVEIDLPTYCRYIQENSDIIRVDDGVQLASVLDGIGDAQQTYENQLAMEKHGVKPLPCFHAGEDNRYLEHYVKNYDYITLGGMVGSSAKQLTVWLDRLWENYLTDSSGRARLKVHGFGITSIPIMERYPWESCDSSSWIQMTSFGAVMVPTIGAVSVSEKSPSRHTAGQHLANMTPLEQQVIIGKLEAAGYTYDRLSRIYESRAAYNMRAFGEINKLIDDARRDLEFHCEKPELF